METLEQNQATEVFSIKRQKVEKLDEKSVEELQKKFLVNFKRSTGDTPRIMRE
jgi:predicted XRE-type DNA-binding protein